jgi:hypothetical protein
MVTPHGAPGTASKPSLRQSGHAAGGYLLHELVLNKQGATPAIDEGTEAA